MKLPSLKDIFGGWGKKETPHLEEEYIIAEPILKQVTDRYSFDQYLKSVAAFEKLAENTKATFKDLKMWKASKKNGVILKKIYDFMRFDIQGFWGELTTVYTHGGRHVLPQRLKNADKWVHWLHGFIELYEEDEISIIENFIFDSFNNFYDVVIKNWRPPWMQYRSPTYLLEEVERIRTDKLGFGEP